MSQSNFVISVRKVKSPRNKEPRFINEPGKARYLEVPDGEMPHPIKHKLPTADWVRDVTARAETDRRARDPRRPDELFAFGDIVVFIHGYNNSMQDVMHRHNLLQRRLGDEGYKGAIVSFDWPSASVTLNYLEDRRDAKATAFHLVEDCIMLLARNQLRSETNKCDINVHLLGHSTGAYVIREAFYEASQRRSTSRINWSVSQVALIGGDIARKSMSADDSKSRGLFRHSARITNYQNPYDSALQVSNVKRVGAAPRVGRVGLPNDAPPNVVNVNVGDHWKSLNEDTSEASGNWSHSWHFDDPLFARDLHHTLKGEIDRNKIPTRTIVDDQLVLKS